MATPRNLPEDFKFLRPTSPLRLASVAVDTECGFRSHRFPEGFEASMRLTCGLEGWE